MDPIIEDIIAYSHFHISTITKLPHQHFKNFNSTLIWHKYSFCKASRLKIDPLKDVLLSAEANQPAFSYNKLKIFCHFSEVASNRVGADHFHWTTQKLFAIHSHLMLVKSYPEVAGVAKCDKVSWRGDKGNAREMQTRPANAHQWSNDHQWSTNKKRFQKTYSDFTPIVSLQQNRWTWRYRRAGLAAKPAVLPVCTQPRSQNKITSSILGKVPASRWIWSSDWLRRWRGWKQ